MTSLNNIFDPLHVALNNSNNVNWIVKLNVFRIDNKHNLIIVINIAVADPGFPVGGSADLLGGGGGRQPPTHTLFGKNICENKRN